MKFPCCAREYGRRCLPDILQLIRSQPATAVQKKIPGVVHTGDSEKTCCLKSVQAEGDAGLGHIIGGNLDTDTVAYYQADEALAHLAGDVSQELMTIGHLYAEHGAGEHSGYHAFKLNLTLAVVVNLLGLGGVVHGAGVAGRTRSVRALLRLAAAIIGGICHYVVLNWLLRAALASACAGLV